MICSMVKIIVNFISITKCDVDSSYPLGAQAEKGSAVRRLKRYVSWVCFMATTYITKRLGVNIENINLPIYY